MTAPDATRSAYGLNLAGLRAEPALLGPPRPDAPTITVRWHTRAGWPSDDTVDTVGRERAELQFITGSRLRLDRVACTADYYGPEVPVDQRAHPYLSPLAVVHNRWLGREVFHAGAFRAAGRAWALVGVREAGKSSLLAGLDAHDCTVLADDIVVTDGRQLFTGPRCVDLREPVPKSHRTVVTARENSRHRLHLPAAGFATPFGGWVFLLWGERLELSPIPTDRLLAIVARRRLRRAMTSDATTLLDLAGRPAWFLTRPKSWDYADESIVALLDTVASAVSSPSR